MGETRRPVRQGTRQERARALAAMLILGGVREARGGGRKTQKPQKPAKGGGYK